MIYGRNSLGGSSLGSSGPKPVEVGKEYEVELTGITTHGDGIARVQGFIIFVKKGKVGQKVNVKIDLVGKTFAVANIVS